MTEWLGRGLQNLLQGFNSPRRLQHKPYPKELTSYNTSVRLRRSFQICGRFFCSSRLGGFMLKLILTAIVTACGLPLKKHQFNRLVLQTESVVKMVLKTIVNYLADIFSDLLFLIKLTTILRPRNRLLLLRSLFITFTALIYLFLAPSTFVNADIPERVFQNQTETALVSIKESVTVEAVPEFKAPVFGYISTYYSNHHRGIDIPKPQGSPIKSFAEGEVIFAGWATGGFGNTVEIKHNLGYVSKYAHLSRIDVVVGQTVKENTIVGGVGSTGNSTGSHLHFELYQDGRTVNPLNYISLKK